MKKLTFGVVAHDFERTFITGYSVLNSVNHYKGQLFMSDGTYAKVLEHTAVISLSENSKNTSDLLMLHFDEELKMHQGFEREFKGLDAGYVYNYDNLHWFSLVDTHPIEWHDTFADAWSLYKTEPTHRTICSSRPVGV